jgi:hypothetical protein
MARRSDEMPPLIAYLFGGGVGVTWIALAIVALTSSFRGLNNDRLDWFLGWGLVGILLLAAGLAALVGTWWHLTRVRRPYH